MRTSDHVSKAPHFGKRRHLCSDVNHMDLLSVLVCPGSHSAPCACCQGGPNGASPGQPCPEGRLLGHCWPQQVLLHWCLLDHYHLCLRWCRGWGIWRSHPGFSHRWCLEDRRVRRESHGVLLLDGDCHSATQLAQPLLVPEGLRRMAPTWRLKKVSVVFRMEDAEQYSFSSLFTLA